MKAIKIREKRMKMDTKLGEKELKLAYKKLLPILEMDKKKAILEIDNFLYELNEQEFFEEYYNEEDERAYYDEFHWKNYTKLSINETIKAVKVDIETSRRILEKKRIPQYFISHDLLVGLRKRSEYISYYLKEKRNKLNEDTIIKLKKLNNASEKIIEDITSLTKFWDMKSLINREIFSANSVSSILYSLKDYESIIEISRYSKEAGDLSFRIKEKCCKFRALKKLRDAEICKKTNKLKKALKLELEAQSLFEEDWEEIFGNEDFYILKDNL